MTNEAAIIEDFHRQIDECAPQIRAAIRRGDRGRLKLYMDGTNAKPPQFTPLPRGQSPTKHIGYP